MFQWQLKYFSASETGSHICDPRLGRVKKLNASHILQKFGVNRLSEIVVSFLE